MKTVVSGHGLSLHDVGAEQKLTLDGVGLGQLAEIGHEVFGNVIPCPTLREAKVDMCTGQFVYVELEPK